MKQNKKYKALAGSGKTIKLKQQISQIAPTTSSNIILLSFNKKLEQENKYLEKTYKNLSVRTFHSLAWGAVTNKFGKFKATSVPNYNN